MHIALTAFALFFGIVTHAACLAPCLYGAEEAYAVDVGDGTEAALGCGFADLTAETGVGDAGRVPISGVRVVE